VSWQFARRCLAEKNSLRLEGESHRYCRRVIDALLVRSNEFHVTITVLTKDGTLRIPPDAHSGSLTKQDRPDMRLVLVSDSEGTTTYEQPMEGAGLPTYCIWSNANQREGLAIVHDIASSDSSLFLYSTDDSDGERPIKFVPSEIGRMHKPFGRQVRGTTLCAPIVAHDLLDEQLSARRCIGSLNISHKTPGILNATTHWIWAEHCAELIGQAFEFYRIRALQMRLRWSGWESTLSRDDVVRDRSQNLCPDELDIRLLRDHFNRFMDQKQWSRQQFADEAKISIKTLNEAILGHFCTFKTLQATSRVLNVDPDVFVRRIPPSPGVG
jgi:hypothetical protein